MIQAVVFDMDGVMFDTERVGNETLIEAGRRLGLPRIEEYCMAILGVNGVRFLEVFKEYYGDYPREKLTEMSRQVRAEWGEKASAVPVKPGLFELIAYLRETGYKVAVATSTARPRVLENFRVTGVDPAWFDEIVTGDQVYKSKPEPDIYLTAARLLGLDPAQCMALEDSPNGIRSASAAGMMTIMVPDIIQPTPALAALAAGVEPDLLAVMARLQKLRAQGE